MVIKSTHFASTETSKQKLDEPGRHSTCPAEPNISGEKIRQSPKLFDLWAMSEKMMFCWRNVFSRVVNNTFHMFSREKLWDKRVFFQKKKYVWLSFLILNEEIPDLWQKFSTRVSKTKSTWSEELFGKTLFGGRYNFMSFDGFSEEKLICKKTQCSSVRHSSCPVEHSKGQISWRNKTFRTFGHWARIFWVSVQKVWQSCQNYFPCDRSNFWIKFNFFSKKVALLILLPTFSEKFQYFLKTDPPALSILHTSRPQKLQNKNWTNQAGILRVRRSLTLRGKKSGSHQNFLTYGQWAKKWCFAGEMFLAELLTTHSICSAEKNFETKGFFPKKYVWLSFLVLNEESPDLWQKFSTRVSKTKFTWPEEFFGRTLFGGRYNLMSFDGFSGEKLICKKTQCSSVRHSSCPVEPNISGEKIWQSPKLFDLWAMSEKMMFCWRNVFSRVVNNTFHMFSREKLWDKRVFSKKICLTFFSDFEWRNSGFVAEVFNKGVINKIHVTRGLFW